MVMMNTGVEENDESGIVEEEKMKMMNTDEVEDVEMQMEENHSQENDDA